MAEEYIKKMYLETLTEEEQYIINGLSVIGGEGISIDVACHILMPHQPLMFNSIMDSLNTRNWLYYDNRTIINEAKVAKVALEVSPIDSALSIKILSALLKHIALNPLDDMMSKREYFVAARLFLSYLLEHNSLILSGNNQIISLFSDVAISFYDNVELSYYDNKRLPQWNLEDRIDFKLCDFLIRLDSFHSDGKVHLRLGSLFNCIFMYDKAKENFDVAAKTCDGEADLFLAKARMFENLSLRGKAFHYAYCAYLTNKEKHNDDKNIEVCLYIAYLCALSMAPKDCKRWKNKVRTILHARRLPTHHIFNIMLKEIEALLHLHDKTLAFQILDSAELEVYQLYGDNAPELSRIAFIRSYVYNEAGQLRNANEEYRRYVYINHFNYAYSKGDTAALYSSIINDNIVRGNIITANYFSTRMQRLYAEDSSIAPGVRFSEALSNSLSCMAERNIPLCGDYLRLARDVFEKELKPKDGLLEEIAPIFHNGVIPDAVYMKEEQRLVNLITLTIYLNGGQINRAKELIEKQIRKGTKYIECSKWQIQMGRVHIKDGNLSEGLKLWEDLLRNAPQSHKFEIAKEITDWAKECDLSYEVIWFYEEALQADVMTYGKAYDIAEMLRSYADILELIGLGDKSEEPWEQAIMVMNSLGDMDGIAQVYLSWGISKEGKDAERLLRKAIRCWKPEPFVFDETLSRMYYYLYHVQVSQDNLSKAACSAREAIRLYPGEYPQGSFSEVGL